MKQKIIFHYDIEDWENIDELIDSIRRLTKVQSSYGFDKSIGQEIRRPLIAKNKHFTLTISKEMDDELPF